MKLENLNVQELSVREQESIDAGGCGCECFPGGNSPSSQNISEVMHYLWHSWVCD